MLEPCPVFTCKVHIHRESVYYVNIYRRKTWGNVCTGTFQRSLFRLSII